jgi:hypothetical protein
MNNASINKSSQSIYAWEDGNNNMKIREKIEMNGLLYRPTREVGFYSGGNSQDLSFGNDRYIDFQIILTDEELTTLAGMVNDYDVDDSYYGDSSDVYRDDSDDYDGNDDDDNDVMMMIMM